MWSVSSNHFADSVRFGSHVEFADMVQIFHLVTVGYVRRDWLWREGILLWHTGGLHNYASIYKKMYINETRLLE